MERLTPSISGKATKSPFLSPHLQMMNHRKSPPLSNLSLSYCPKSRREQKKHPKTKFDSAHPTRLSYRQWVIYIMYCWGFLSLGLFTSSPGPMLPTYEETINASLATISYIFCARAIGFCIGSVISGYVMDIYQKHLISDEQGTKYLLKDNQTIADYFWSLPKWSFWPMSAHNVFSISLIIASITNALTPYADSVYALAILVIINGVCFGNINTFANVLLLTLFDVELVHDDIDFDIIYHYNQKITELHQIEMMSFKAESNSIAGAATSKTRTHTVLIAGNDEKDKLITTSTRTSYGSVPGAKNKKYAEKQQERVGPFMQFLQATYALGGLLAPIMIQISFELTGSATSAFWFFSILYFPPSIVLLFFPEPMRISLISERLKQIENDHKIRLNASSQTAVDDEESINDDSNNALKITKNQNKEFWAKILCIGFAIFLLWYVGAQVSFGMYVTTYAINHLKFSAAAGRYLASANWTGLFAGRFTATLISHKMSALNMVRMDLIGMTLGCLLLFFSLDNAYFVWISSVMVGFFMASVWPSIFVWAETMTPVTGIFASILVGGGSLGEFIIPAVLGNIMDEFGAQYFNHVMVALSLLLLITLIFNQIIAKRFSHFL